MFALSPFLNCVFGNFCHLVVITFRTRYVSCLLNTVWLVCCECRMGWVDLDPVFRAEYPGPTRFKSAFRYSTCLPPKYCMCWTGFQLNRKSLWSAFIARSDRASTLHIKNLPVPVLVATCLEKSLFRPCCQGPSRPGRICTEPSRAGACSPCRRRD